MSTNSKILLDLVNDISRHIGALNAYIEAARSFPDDNSRYAKEFHLDPSMEQKLQRQINSSVALNKVLKGHSQTFHDTTFKDIFRLLSEVKQLTALSKELSAAEVYGIDSKGVVISAGLAEFVIQCITDAGDIEREMRYLGRDFQDDGELLDVVDQLKRAREVFLRRDPKAQMIWAPLIGWLPHAVSSTRLGDRLRVLNEQEDEVITRQKITLNCEMMESNWKSVLDLLEPARQAVSIIEGFIAQLTSQLMIIQDTADIIQSIADDFAQNYVPFVDPTKLTMSILLSESRSSTPTDSSEDEDDDDGRLDRRILAEDDYAPFVDPTKLTMSILLSDSPSSSTPTDSPEDDDDDGRPDHDPNSRILAEDDYAPFVDPTKLTMSILLSNSPSFSTPTNSSEDEEDGRLDDGHLSKVGDMVLTSTQRPHFLAEEDYVPFVDPTKLTMRISLSESPGLSTPTESSEDDDES